MGVKLKEVLILKKIEFSQLSGKIVAIDAPNIIMALFNFSRKTADDSYAGLILDRTQRPISHLYGLLFRVNFYYSKKIFPIFCFDGRDSQLKKLKTKDKLNDFIFTQNWYQDSLKKGNKYLAKQIALSSEYMWNNIIIESKKLLGALGVPYIESPASAESQCAQLVKDKIAHYSNSQDFDSLLFGAPKVIQNLSKSLRRKVQGRWTYNKIEPQLIDLKLNLRNLDINQFQLVDMAILIGTDYFSGIEGIGPKKALTLIKQHYQLESIIKQEENNYNFEKLTPEIIKKIRKIFLVPEVLTRLNIQNICWNAPNKYQINSLLCEEHFLNQTRVQNNLNKLEINFEKCRDWFTKIKDKLHVVQKTLEELL